MSALLLEKHEVQAILCSHAKAISSNLQYNTMTIDEQGDVVLTWVSPPEKPAAERTFWDKLFRRNKVRVYPEMDRPQGVYAADGAGPFELSGLKTGLTFEEAADRMTAFASTPNLRRNA